MNNNPKKKSHKNKIGNIDPTVAGIDIGSKLIHVAIPDGNEGAVVKEYGTTTPELHLIAQDLKEAGVVTAVMEATGVYWIPLFEILESIEYGLQPVLVDAKSVKNVPGRKTDVVDCQWLQVLWSAGLLRAAFRPPRDRLPLRDLSRTRRSIGRTKQKALVQIEKTLQLMNIKLSMAVSDIAGLSGMAIVRAIAKGEQDPEKLAALRHSSCKRTKDEFVAALTGNFPPQHLFALVITLNQYDFSARQMAECDAGICKELEALPNVVDTPPPVRDKDRKANGKYSTARKPDKNSFSFDVRELLWRKSGVDFTSLPGVSEGSALVFFAELGGASVAAWNSEKEFASWLKLCPGNNISGGKRRKCKHIPSVNPIAQYCRLSAVSIKHSKSHLGAWTRRICSRTDKPKGMKAAAHRLCRTLYQMCKRGMNYVELGEARSEALHQARLLKTLKERAAEQGYELVVKVA